MTNHEQTQADLLDEFRHGHDANPPAGLDSGIAAMAVMLEERLSPPAPSARFVQTLGRRLDAESSRSDNHRRAGILPPLPDQTIPSSTPPNDRKPDSHDEPRRSWLFEVSRIVAAGLAVALVGAILMLVFRDANDALAPGAGEATAHPGEILVSWDPNGGKDYKLFIVDTAGGEPRKLTPGPAEIDGVSERFPAWSPDGQQVAFLQGTETEDEANLYVINADGSNLFNISDAAGIGQVSDFSWSPDGTQIALTANVPGAADIYTVHVDGSNLRRLTNDGEAGWGVAWSPDGTRIAFIGLNGMLGNVQIIDPDGSNARSLDTDIGVDHLSWSPDGAQLAFIGGRYIKSVYVVNADGSQPRQFTDHKATASVQPEWSPDGQSIAFIAYDDGGSVSGTFIADPAGSEWRSLTPIMGSHKWSPDGSQLAIVTPGIDRSGAPTSRSTLYVIDAGGSNLRPLLQDASLSAEEPAWRPPVTGEEPPALPTPTPITPTETGADRLYVVTSNGVTITDPTTNEEIYSIDAVNPDAALSPDGSRLYVLGTGDIFQLTAFDAADGTKLWNVPVEDRIRWIGDHGPSTLAVSPDGNHVYLATSSAPDVQQIQVLDAATGEWIDETETIIGYCPAMLHPSGDGNNLFLVCQRSGQVHVLNLHTLEFDGGSKCCGPNVGSIMSSDGTLLYVVQTNGTGGYGALVLDTSGPGIAGSISGMFELGQEESPPLLGEMVALSPDGTRLYVALGTEDNDGDAGTHDVREIAVFDTSGWVFETTSLEEVDRITLAVPLKGGAFTASPDGQYIYASERLQLDSDGKLIRIDVESGETSTVLVRDAEILRVLMATQTQLVETAPSSILTTDLSTKQPPPAKITYADQSQLQNPRSFCWTASDESRYCEEGDGPPPPEPALVAPPGAELIFAVDEIEEFTIQGARAHSLVVNTEVAADDLTYSGSTVDLPFEQAATRSQLTAALAEGDYAISVTIEAQLPGGPDLTATYDFRVRISHAANAPTGNQIEPSELAEFDRFPVWSLGDTFGEFVLDRVEEHHHDSSGENISIEFIYVAEDGGTGVGITIVSQGPLPEAELRAREESRQGLGEPVVVNGEDGWMIPVDDNVRTIEIALNGGHLTIFATDQETALAAAEAVQRVNEPSASDIDPFAPAFPDAEVVHVVSVSHLEQIGESYTTETWIDQVSGDVIVQRYDAGGNLLSASMRHGLRAIDYAPPSLAISEVLSPDDPILQHQSGHLDGYRKQLQNGSAEVIGQEEIDGRPAITISVELYPGRHATVYLDAETLFPLRFDGNANDDWTMPYPAIETLGRDEMPVELFELSFPDVTHTFFGKELTEEETRNFASYAIWGLGPSFGEYTLKEVMHVTATTPDTPGTDRVTALYGTDNTDERIQIDAYGPEAAREWEAWESKRHPSREAIMIQGQNGWIESSGPDGHTELVFQWYDGYLMLNAPNRETALAAAEALQQVNGL